MYRLLFQSGPQRGRRVAIRQGPVILGRHPDAALRLPEPEVALQHVQLEDLPEGGVRLRRLAEGATVLINSQDVATADLRDGDLIAIGPHVLKFESGQAPVEKQTGRRIGMLQILTLVSVALLLIGQMIFLFTVSIKPPAPAVTVANAATNAPPAAEALTNVVVAPVSPVVVNASNATPVQVASVTPAPAVSTYSNQMTQMRTDLTRLQKDVAALPPPALMTNAAGPEFSADDLVLAQARKMFAKALAHAAQIDAEELDGELATIQNMAPEFMPPVIERAQRLAQRKQFAEALAQWQKVQKLAPNDDLRTRATDEIAKLKVLRVAPPKTTEVKEQRTEVSGQKSDSGGKKSGEVAMPSPATINHPPSVPLRRAARPIASIKELEPQKLLAGEKYDEMRLLRITVAPLGAAPLDPAATEVVVTFFDRGEKSGHVAPSRAVVPGSALRAAAVTSPGSPLEFSASYLVPRNFRQQTARQTGETARYFGYRVQLFCNGELQDQRDQPANLLPAE